jgi:hypothetical protein
MPFYAQRPDLRARRLAAELGRVAWTALWIAIARGVHGGGLALAAPARALAAVAAAVRPRVAGRALATAPLPRPAAAGPRAGYGRDGQ